MEGLIPKTLEEALDALSTRRFIPVAGGTDLMVKYRRGRGIPAYLPYPPLFIGHISELSGIEIQNDEIVIKGATTLSQIHDSPIVPSILRKAVSGMAAPGIRNMGTIGGNIVNSSPAGDTLPPLYVLNAKVVLLSKNERRCIYIYEFIKGPGKNVLREDELLYEVRFYNSLFTHELYRKIGTRKANALSKLSIAGIATVSGEVIEDFRVSFGAVAPTPVRIKSIEERIKSKKISELSDDFIGSVIKEYAPYIRPIDDQRSFSVYRKKVSLRLLGEFLKEIRNFRS